MSEKMQWEKLLDKEGPVNPQDISDFDQHRREIRETLTLFQRPLATLKLFLQGGSALIIFCVHYCLSHKFFLFFVLPMLLAWLVLDNVPGSHTNAINDFEFAVEFTTWWVGLGILSSIGLGSGLQSGVLFLFPHVIKVCLAAQTCKTLDFESNTNIWFRQPENLFQCPEVTEFSTPVTFMGVWKKIILVCFLQSAGTAIGEIPPYWMTKAARLAAMESGTENPDDVPEELEANSKYDVVNRGKLYLIWFLRTYGFYGVLLMASYPNIAFDLCGICCGHFLMPFWTFFLATFLGKAIIRNAYQSFIYVALCSAEYMELMINLLQRLTPDSLQLDHYIRQALEESRESFHKNVHKGEAVDEAGGGGIGQAFMFWWQIFMTSVLTMFFLSCISHFAQFYQLTLDQEDSNKLRRRLPNNVRDQIISPNSGRLKLPPPTPVTARRARLSARSESAKKSKCTAKKLDQVQESDENPVDKLEDDYFDRLQSSIVNSSKFPEDSNVDDSHRSSDKDQIGPDSIS